MLEKEAQPKGSTGAQKSPDSAGLFTGCFYLLEQTAQGFHCIRLISLGFLGLLLGVGFGLRLGKFVTTFVDLLLRCFEGFHFQGVFAGFGGIDLGLQVSRLLLAVAGVAAAQLGAQGATQCAQVGGVGRQGEQAEQKGRAWRCA